MQSNATTVKQYLSELSKDRQSHFKKLRQTILDNIPAGFEEQMSYGMIGYVVPHKLYPAGYHCKPELPLPFLNIASQKNYFALYHMGIYGNSELMKCPALSIGELIKVEINNLKLASLLAISTAVFSTNSMAQNTEELATGTGLDLLVEIINTDQRLKRKVPENEIAEGASAANSMNHIIVEAIKETGVANDAVISTADTRELNDYIFANHHDQWVVLHGDDENGEETGFHLVQNDGARTRLYDRNAINRVADSIYHLGFETHKRNRLMNEDGNKNASFRRVGEWVNNLLEQDLAGLGMDLTNPLITEVEGSTGTGLDRISTGDMREGAAAANQMNKIIVDALNVTGVTEDDVITKSEVVDLVNYIQINAQDEWIELHGDDEDGEETGYHLVQSDGAKTRLFGKNAINRVFDGIYHLGFGVNARGNRLVNEDGNNNAGIRKIAAWLNQLLGDDMRNDRI
ncbi:hypothetical protein GQR58_010613 [Nymphon striatum]|nr:hypothetical protein GQR58_010613 [Nymphon striatum]